MTDKEACELSGRSRRWLQEHSCCWCEQSLWWALKFGCGAIYDRCDPTKKDFGPDGRLIK